MSNRRQIFQERLVIGFLILLLAVAGCTKLDESPGDQEIQQGFPDVELFNGSIIYTREGVTQFSVKAPHISRFEVNDLLLLEGGFRADFYNQTGVHTAYLTAQTGEVIERDQSLLARGNVVVNSDSGLVLYADSLYYDPKQELVRSDGFVIIVTDLDSLTGTGFTASPQLGDWELKNTSGQSWREVDAKE